MAQQKLSAAEQNRMRQDAQRRQREMHRSSVKESSPVPPPEPPPGKQTEPISKPIENPLEGLLSSMDNDKLLLLVLLFVLWREGGDIKLIAALAYILL